MVCSIRFDFGHWKDFVYHHLTNACDIAYNYIVDSLEYLYSSELIVGSCRGRDGENVHEQWWIWHLTRTGDRNRGPVAFLFLTIPNAADNVHLILAD